MDKYRADMLETAADWADRLGELNEAERRTLSAWLEESPEHAQAFARMRRLMTDTALIEALEPEEGGAAEAEPAPALPPAAPRRHSRVREQVRGA
ncbi:FecR/PupR family sigma factor regulator, partial [Novosphingobium beihaiensis]